MDTDIDMNMGMDMDMDKDMDMAMDWTWTWRRTGAMLWAPGTDLDIRCIITCVLTS